MFRFSQAVMSDQFRQSFYSFSLVYIPPDDYNHAHVLYQNLIRAYLRNKELRFLQPSCDVYSVCLRRICFVHQKIKKINSIQDCC